MGVHAMIPAAPPWMLKNEEGDRLTNHLVLCPGTFDNLASCTGNFTGIFEFIQQRFFIHAVLGRIAQS
jgi:hypothetical protein